MQKLVWPEGVEPAAHNTQMHVPGAVGDLRIEQRFSILATHVGLSIRQRVRADEGAIVADGQHAAIGDHQLVGRCRAAERVGLAIDVGRSVMGDGLIKPELGVGIEQILAADAVGHEINQRAVLGEAEIDRHLGIVVLAAERMRSPDGLAGEGIEGDEAHVRIIGGANDDEIIVGRELFDLMIFEAGLPLHAAIGEAEADNPAGGIAAGGGEDQAIAGGDDAINLLDSVCGVLVGDSVGRIDEAALGQAGDEAGRHSTANDELAATADDDAPIGGEDSPAIGEDDHPAAVDLLRATDDSDIFAPGRILPGCVAGVLTGTYGCELRGWQCVQGRIPDHFTGIADAHRRQGRRCVFSADEEELRGAPDQQIAADPRDIFWRFGDGRAGEDRMIAAHRVDRQAF